MLKRLVPALCEHLARVAKQLKSLRRRISEQAAEEESERPEVAAQRHAEMR
jgi:hypothetical protein